jgi:hypothetical protein
MKTRMFQICCLIILLAMISFSCSIPKLGAKTTEETERTEATQEEIEITETAEEETEVPPPIEVKPTKIPPTKTPEQPGFSRSNPLPVSELIITENWTVEVLEVLRGDVAWSKIKATSSYSMPPQEGKEYIAIRLKALNTYADSESHQISACDFSVTGDLGILYGCIFVAFIEPALNAELFSGGETEGWIIYLIHTDDTNLELVFNEVMLYENPQIRYAELDPGARIKMPDLSIIKPNDLGLSRDKPAKIGDTVITEDWQIQIHSYLRGEDAWNQIKQWTDYAQEPEEGMEYLLVDVSVKNLGIEDVAIRVDGMSFKSSGSRNVVYDILYVYVPGYLLETSLYPGGEERGYVVLPIAIGETNIVVIFEPILEYEGVNVRYISLE